MNKRVAVLLAVSILAPALAMANGSKESDAKAGQQPAKAAEAKKVEMRLGWWGNTTRDAQTIKVIELYQSKNPNVTIEPENVAWAGYWDRINTQVAAGNLPDVMQHDYAYLTQFAARKQMADLTPFVANKTINLEGIDESFLSGGRIGGKLYGVNLGTNALTLMYDPAVLAKAGIAEPTKDWTWADFEKISIEIFKKTGVQTIPFTTDPKVGFDNWIHQTGLTFYSPDGKSLGFTDASQLVEFWNVFLRIKAAGALTDPAVAFVTVTVDESQFAKGKCWCNYVWSNQVVSEQAAAKRDVKLALLPKIANSKRPGTYLKPSMFFAIPEMGTNKQEAAKFINFFINDLEANNILLAERGVPIVPAVREALKAKVTPVNKQVFDFIDLVGKGNACPIDPPDPAASGEILKLFHDTTMAVMMEQTSATDAASSFMKQANAILAK